MTDWYTELLDLPQTMQDGDQIKVRGPELHLSNELLRSPLLVSDAPKNAHRQTIEDVRTWCEEAGLVIELEKVEMAGLSIIARKI